jgi:N-acetylglucosaminyldiphosphoundecaprenol N-acetyl-beta-D-mannosaminyltransferase
MSTNLNCQLNILGLRIDAVSSDSALKMISAWAENGEQKMVCAANVHMSVEAWDHPEFKKMLSKADLVLPDGSGLAMGLSLLYGRRVRRFRGPDLMLKVCETAHERGLEVGFYGGREEFREDLIGFLLKQYPKLKVNIFIVPPFREITEEENGRYVETINKSGIKILFVGIGCPKQEKWIFNNRKMIKAVMLGVGGAFDQFSGRVKITPKWIQKLGIEWLFRLINEPKRLWRRNFIHSSRYLLLVFNQFVAHLFCSGKRFFSGRSA